LQTGALISQTQFRHWWILFRQFIRCAGKLLSNVGLFLRHCENI